MAEGKVPSAINRTAFFVMYLVFYDCTIFPWRPSLLCIAGVLLLYVQTSLMQIISVYCLLLPPPISSSFNPRLPEGTPENVYYRCRGLAY